MVSNEKVEKVVNPPQKPLTNKNFKMESSLLFLIRHPLILQLIKLP
jgi:hypothetical protein